MFAVNFTHPIELVKTRVQVSNEGIMATCSSTLRNEGVSAFWKGIPWAYCREGSYTAIRLGAYAPVRDAIGAGDPSASIGLKFLAGEIDKMKHCQTKSQIQANLTTARIHSFK